MPYFKPKAASFEAVHNVTGNEVQVVNFLNHHKLTWWATYGNSVPHICIQTATGVIRAGKGDWIAMMHGVAEVYSEYGFNSFFEEVKHVPLEHWHPTLF